MNTRSTASSLVIDVIDRVPFAGLYRAAPCQGAHEGGDPSGTVPMPTIMA